MPMLYFELQMTSLCAKSITRDDFGVSSRRLGLGFQLTYECYWDDLVLTLASGLSLPLPSAPPLALALPSPCP